MRWLIVLAAVLPGCLYFDSADEPRCENQACTDLFAMITVEVVNASNAPVTGLSTQSRYLEGAVQIMTSQDPINNGTYVVVDDNFLGQALPDREHHTIRFEATAGALQLTADYVIAAGECTCHVSKVSGPDMLVFP
jgi:hypothetical protein